MSFLHFVRYDGSCWSGGLAKCKACMSRTCPVLLDLCYAKVSAFRMDDGNIGDSWLVLMYGKFVSAETQKKNMMNAQCGGMKRICVSCVFCSN